MIETTRFGYWKASFAAMGSPCELLVDTDDASIAREALGVAVGEVRRIEEKFSRYRDDSTVAAIHRGRGEPTTVDDETAALLDLAAGLYERSDGRFDITCGVLRQAWTFDGRAAEPDAEQIARLLERVGWSKVRWQRPELLLPREMEIDFGGLGKEYAADRVAGILARRGWTAMVSLGGDVVATGPRSAGEPWWVGVASPEGPSPHRSVELHGGALATSGDTERYVMVDGRRLGHILDPRTGWPVRDAPRSVTVRAETCTTAGALAQLALLSGADAEPFLTEQGVEHWCAF